MTRSLYLATFCIICTGCMSSESASDIEPGVLAPLDGVPVAAPAKGEAQCDWKCWQPPNAFMGQFTDLDVTLTGIPARAGGQIVYTTEFIKNTAVTKQWKVNFCCDAPDITCTYHRRSGKTTKPCPDTFPNPDDACATDGGSVTHTFKAVPTADIGEADANGNYCGAPRNLDPKPKFTGCISKTYLSDNAPTPPDAWFAGACANFDDKDYGYSMMTLAKSHCVAARPAIPSKKVEMSCEMPVNTSSDTGTEEETFTDSDTGSEGETFTGADTGSGEETSSSTDSGEDTFTGADTGSETSTTITEMGASPP